MSLNLVFSRIASKEARGSATRLSLVPTNETRDIKFFLLFLLKWSCSSDGKRASKISTVSTHVSSSLDEGNRFFHKVFSYSMESLDIFQDKLHGHLSQVLG